VALSKTKAQKRKETRASGKNTLPSGRCVLVVNNSRKNVMQKRRGEISTKDTTNTRGTRDREGNLRGMEDRWGTKTQRHCEE